MTTTKNSSCQPLHTHNLAFSCDSNNRVVVMKFNRHRSCCPTQLLVEYLSLRGNHGCAIFITRGGANLETVDGR